MKTGEDAVGLLLEVPDVLAEAKAEASVVWEADEIGDNAHG